MDHLDAGRSLTDVVQSGSRWSGFTGRVSDAVDKAAGSGTRGLSAVGNLSSLLLDASGSAAVTIVRRRFSWEEFADQAWFLISVSVVPTLLIAIPFGIVLVLEVGGLATSIGATSFVGAVDAIGTVREAAPIITALLLAGAGGSAICADLGARTIRDEISALEVMGFDPVELLVAPRLLATVVVALLLNGIVAMAGILSGYVAAVYMLRGSAGGVLNSFSAFSQPADLIESEVKAAWFGLIAGIVACYKGLGVKRGAAGVGEAVNQSVVVTGLALFLFNLLFTEIFLILVPPRVL
jgi:phospholipid/cholesterol/gamma-HCH transport system permease protein